jgi:hypothetical protein
MSFDEIFSTLYANISEHELFSLFDKHILEIEFKKFDVRILPKFIKIMKGRSLFFLESNHIIIIIEAKNNYKFAKLRDKLIQKLEFMPSF